MISYCGKSENILARNLMVLISSVEIIAVYWLWSVALVGSMYTQDEGVLMWIHIHGESIGQAQIDLNMILYQA